MWLDQPQTEGSTPITPLLRCRAGGSIQATLTGDPLRCFVHFANHRSWPCTGFQCGLCKRGISKRCYAYYPVANKEGVPAILEMTSLMEASLRSQMEPETHETRGEVLVHRAPGKRNNPCSIKWKNKEENKKSGGPTINESELKLILMRIWNLPNPNGEEEEREYLNKLNDIIQLKTTNQTNRT